MSRIRNLRPLRYIAEALSQMAATLRDFEMEESAGLLEKARNEINAKLANRPLKEGFEN